MRLAADGGGRGERGGAATNDERKVVAYLGRRRRLGRRRGRQTKRREIVRHRQRPRRPQRELHDKTSNIALPAAKPSPRANTTTHNPTHKADLKYKAREGGTQGARGRTNKGRVVKVQRGGGDEAWAGSWRLPWVGGGGGGGEDAVPATEEVLDFELHSSDGTADVLFLAIDRCLDNLFLSLDPSIELFETTREKVELIFSDTRHRRDQVGGCCGVGGVRWVKVKVKVKGQGQGWCLAQSFPICTRARCPLCVWSPLDGAFQGRQRPVGTTENPVGLSGGQIVEMSIQSIREQPT